MVQAVRGGESQRSVARRFQVSRATVQYWVQRAADQPLDEVDWSDHSSAPHRVHNRTPAHIESMIIERRRQLKKESDLGFYGAQEVYKSFEGDGLFERRPSVRTIGRVAVRRGELDGQRRQRRPAPPRAWYLPEAAAGRRELDAFDLIEGLVIEGLGEVEIFTGKALWSPQAAAFVQTATPAQTVVECLESHWRTYGLPYYVQFDNDARFQGGHNWPDVVGRVARFCLSLGVAVVFVPPREHGFQNFLENFNGLWQQKVWERFHHASVPALQQCSDRFLQAYMRRRASSNERAPQRRPFPPFWRLDLQSILKGSLIYLRRTDDQGVVSLLGRRFPVDPLWVHRLIRCEVDLDRHGIRFFRLRRREPEDQPLSREIEYRLPNRRFRE